MKKTNNKGFTLIELLIVIGIIAILAAAVIIAINPGQQFEQARNATRWSHMNSIVNATYSYTIAEGGTFPTCIGDHEDAAAPYVDATECSDELVTDGFMSGIPRDPQIGVDDGCSGYIMKLESNRVHIKPYEDADDEDTTIAGACADGVSDNVDDLEVIQ